MKRLFSRVALLLALSVLPAFAAASDEQDIEDRISFQVEVERIVQNDRAVATLNATAEDKDPAELAQAINETMAWALERLKGQSTIEPRSGSYRTYPVYDDRKIVRWRGSQELQLESGSLDSLAQLIGRLQERLQVQSMQFLVSTARRHEVEAALTEEALAAFQQRAELVRKSLGAGSYRLMDLNISAGGHRPPLPLRAEAMAMGRVDASAPALEEGTSTITLQVSGRIHLLRE